MGKAKFQGDETREYPEFSLVANPDDIVDFGEADPPADGRWVAVPAKTKTTEETS